MVQRILVLAMANLICLVADGLTADQIPDSHRNSLVKKMVRCLDVDEAGLAIIDESLEPYFTQLQRAEIAAMTGAVPMAETLDGCREQARRRFQKAVRPFTDREAEALSILAKGMADRVQADYPLFARQTWRFIKTANYLCGGFAWTRGPCIVLSQRHVESITEARHSSSASEFARKHGPLLLHEQMHVLQRLDPTRFVSLYTDVFGFTQANVKPNPWLTERQITNPDAVRLEWLFATDKDADHVKYFWPRTILRTLQGVPIMGSDFQLLAVEVQQDGAGWRVKLQDNGMPVREPAALETLSRRFPVNRGLDHPNEIAAYMFPPLVLAAEQGHRTPANAAGANRTVPSVMEKQFADWCEENLR